MKENHEKKLRPLRNFVDRLLVIYRLKDNEMRKYDEFISVLHSVLPERSNIFGKGDVYTEQDLVVPTRPMSESGAVFVMGKILDACSGLGKDMKDYGKMLDNTIGKNMTRRKYLGLDKDSVMNLLRSLSRFYQPASGENKTNSIFVNHLVVLSVQKGNIANSNSNQNSKLYAHSQILLKHLFHDEKFIRPGVGINPLIIRRVKELRNKEGVKNGYNLPVVKNDFGMNYNQIIANRVFTHKTLSFVSNNLRDFARLQYVLMILGKKFTRKNKQNTPATSH